MSCGCNKTNLQGTQYCQECMPDEVTWLVPVSKEPDPFLMDRNHAYIMPNNTIYVLSHDRTQAIDISGNDIDLTPYALKTELATKITELNQKLTIGIEGAKYYEGEGIRIDADKRIHSTVNLTEVNERLDAIEQAGNSPYKAGTGIEITSDLTINNTVTTDAIESRVQALEEKEDQNTTYTAGTGLQLNGTELSVDPNDLPGLDQVDDLRDRVTTLEGKADADTKYTAGTNVQISPTNVISATDTKYSGGTNVQISPTNVIYATDTKYTAGSNVQISSANVISATDTKYSAGSNVQISPTNVISFTETKYSAGAGLNLDNSNTFSLIADSYPMGSGFTYTNPFITIGFIDIGQKDVKTGAVTHTVNFNTTNAMLFKNILLINPTNLHYHRYSNQITSSSSSATFSFVAPLGTSYYSSATSGTVLIIAEVIS